MMSGMGNTENGKSGGRKDVGCRNLIRRYIENTTIHGIPDTISKDSYGKRRYTWIVLLILMTILLVASVAYQFYRFSHYPTLTKVDTLERKYLPFPAVTVCSLNQYENKTYDEEVDNVVRALSEVDNILSVIFANVAPSGVDIEGEELSRIMNESFHRLSVKICNWGKDVCEHYSSRLTEFGLCKTYNGNISNRWMSHTPGNGGGLRLILDIEQDVYYFSRTIQMGIKVILHEPDEEPFPEKYGFDIGPEKSAVATIRRNKEISLESPYQSLSGEYCVNTKSANFRNPLQRYETYSRESCLKECLLDKMEKVIGCRRFFDPGNTSLCSSQQMQKHALDTEHLTTDDCACNSPCEQIWYDHSISYADMSSKFMSKYIVKRGLADNAEYIRENIIDLRIYYNRLIENKIEQVPELSLEMILGTLGGMMGLYLGASLLSLIQLVELIVQCVCSYRCSDAK